MAVTLNVVENSVSRDGYLTYIDVTGPASYTTGGETLTAAQVNQMMPKLGGGLLVTDVTKGQFFESEIDASGRYLVLDRTNQKIMFWAGTQVAAATNLSAVTIRCRIKYGKTNLG